jgi:hypothetical protein
MRRRIRILVMAIICMAGMQVAFAQDNKGIADPNASAAPTAKGGDMDVTHESVMDPAPTNTDPSVAPASPAVVPDTTKKKDVASEKMRPGYSNWPPDYSKNPWWDPKDWDFISNQNP